MYDMSGLLGDTVDKFEEVDEIPEETGTSYNEEVNSMIRQRYSLSEELAILRQKGFKARRVQGFTTSTQSIVKWK